MHGKINENGDTEVVFHGDLEARSFLEGFNERYGVMFLIDNPSAEYTEVTRTKRTQTYESLASESTTHRVFFATRADNVTAWESAMLNEYLLCIVNRSGL
jgi:hypothetical protein